MRNYIIAIKNAAKSQRREVKIPFTKLNKEVSKVLKGIGFLEEFKEEKLGNLKFISAKLAYDKRTPRFVDVVAFTKPSLKRYISKGHIKDLEKKGNRTLIISTSQGVMTGREAVKKGIGGEILFAIW